MSMSALVLLALLGGCGSTPSGKGGETRSEQPKDDEEASGSRAARTASAEALIREIYAPYLDGNGGPGLERSGKLTESFQALWEREARLAGDGPGVVNFDVVVNAQDWSIRDLALSTTLDGTHASVVATFQNFDTPVTVTWNLILEGNTWKIDNVRPEGFDVREALRAATVPASGG